MSLGILDIWIRDFVLVTCMRLDTLKASDRDERVPIERKQRMPGQQPCPLSIVVVEDDEDSRDLLQLFLERRGHEVVVASDGVQGVSVIVQRPPQLALVDLSLPQMNGLELARCVRADNLARSVYLVALTGFGSTDDRIAAMDAGFDEYILKPIQPGDMDRLLERVRRSLQVVLPGTASLR